MLQLILELGEQNPNKEALLHLRFGRHAPRHCSTARHTTEKYFLLFSFRAHPIFSSKRKRKLLCGVLLLTSRAAGLRFGSGEAEFPPHAPSASPLLDLAFFSADLESVFYKAKCAARDDVALVPTHPCTGNDKELPWFSLTKQIKLCIILVVIVIWL